MGRVVAVHGRAGQERGSLPAGVGAEIAGRPADGHRKRPLREEAGRTRALWPSGPTEPGTPSDGLSGESASCRYGHPRTAPTRRRPGTAGRQHRRRGKGPFPQVARLVGQVPAIQGNGPAGGVIQLDPVRSIPIAIPQPGTIGGDEFIDQHGGTAAAARRRDPGGTSSASRKLSFSYTLVPRYTRSNHLQTRISVSCVGDCAARMTRAPVAAALGLLPAKPREDLPAGRMAGRARHNHPPAQATCRSRRHAFGRPAASSCDRRT
jgi:hypothetical protein